MVLSERFEEALLFATRLHSKQIRKGTAVPYVAHLLAVVGIALEYGADEDETIAALLHDAIEDQGGASVRDEIRQRFGEKVVDIVNGCTDADVRPKPPWQARKEAYITHLRDASPSVRLVSAADKVHNIQTIIKDYRAIGDTLWGRFKGGKEGTLWYYRALVSTFREGGSTPMIEELDRLVTALETLTSRKEIVDGNK